MKLATRLMPTVAAKKVMAATTVRVTLSMRATMSVGLVSVSPNTTTVPAVITSAISEKIARLTGRPRKLPMRICRSLFTKRAKSP